MVEQYQVPGKTLNFWDDLKSVIEPVSIFVSELDEASSNAKRQKAWAHYLHISVFSSLTLTTLGCLLGRITLPKALSIDNRIYPMYSYIFP